MIKQQDFYIGNKLIILYNITTELNQRIEHDTGQVAHENFSVAYDYAKCIEFYPDDIMKTIDPYEPTKDELKIIEDKLYDEEFK